MEGNFKMVFVYGYLGLVASILAYTLFSLSRELRLLEALRDLLKASWKILRNNVEPLTDEDWSEFRKEEDFYGLIYTGIIPTSIHRARK